MSQGFNKCILIKLELPYASPFELWTWAYLKTVKRWFEMSVVVVK